MGFECNLQINFVTFSACLTYLHKLYVLGLFGPQYNRSVFSQHLPSTFCSYIHGLYW